MSLTNLFTSLLTNLISKTQISKTLDCLIWVFTTHEKTLNQRTTTINLKYLLPNQILKFDLPDGSYSVSDIQDYFQFIIKKHKTLTANPPIQIYPNKTKSRIVFKVKTGDKLELLSSETMKLLQKKTQKKR